MEKPFALVPHLHPAPREQSQSMRGCEANGVRSPRVTGDGQWTSWGDDMLTRSQREEAADRTPTGPGTRTAQQRTRERSPRGEKLGMCWPFQGPLNKLSVTTLKVFV